MSSVRPDTEKTLKPLSCANCRQRKVKCDKVHPTCAPCRRIGVPCVFPDRKRHRKPRNNRQAELLNRLSRLEGIVGTFDPDQLESAGPESEQLHPLTEEHAPPHAAAADPGLERPDNVTERVKRPLRLEAKGSTEKFMSPVFWATLCKEVNGLKQTLEEPSEDEESDDDAVTDGLTPSSSERSSGPVPYTLTSHALFGNPAAAELSQLSHPPPQQIAWLCTTYFTNVDLVLKIVHRPTVTKAVQLFLDSGRTRFAPALPECLLFAMYFGAVVSCRPGTCQDSLGEAKPVLAERFRLAAEIALAKADYLNTTDLEVLQALTIYVACLRAHTGDRASWALLALAVRLARALGLHSDASGAGLDPYAAELRRRIWWQLVVLDVRAVEDRGTEPIINTDSFDTVLSTNADDADFGPGTPAPLVAREGPTDNSMSLCTSMCCGVFIHLNDPAARFATASSEDEILSQIRRLESIFITPATDNDPRHLPSFLAARTVRIIILKFWLFLQYPFQARLAATRPRVPRDNILRTAVAIMELTEAMRVAPGAEHHEWWTETYVQWHPLAVALAELCEQTRGELVDRAWRIIDRVFPLWRDRIADAKRGTLWKPIRKLLKRAREARERGQQKFGQAEVPSNMDSKDKSRKEEHAMEVDVTGAEEAEVNIADPSTMLDAVVSPSQYLIPEFNPLQYGFFGQESTTADADTSLDWANWAEFVQDAHVSNNDTQGFMPRWAI